MAPPSMAWLPVNVLPSTSRVESPSLRIAPPGLFTLVPETRLLENVQSWTVRFAPAILAIPPPPPMKPLAWLLVTVTSERVRFAWSFRIPPPRVAFPSGPATVVPLA